MFFPGIVLGILGIEVKCYLTRILSLESLRILTLKLWNHRAVSVACMICTLTTVKTDRQMIARFSNTTMADIAVRRVLLRWFLRIATINAIRLRRDAVAQIRIMPHGCMASSRAEGTISNKDALISSVLMIHKMYESLKNKIYFRSEN